MDWINLGAKLSRYIRPATFPLAVKLVKPGETIPEKARKIRKNTTICQLLTIARRTGRTMYGGPEEFVCHGVMALGFADYTDKELEEYVKKTVEWIHPLYTKTPEIAEKSLKFLAKIPPNSTLAIVASPLEWTRIQPDMVLVYGNPAQISLIINALVWGKEEGAFLESKHVFTVSSCDGFARCYMEKKPQIVIPTYGTRIFSFVMDEEILAIIPAEKLQETVEALEKLWKAGVRYPTPYQIEMDVVETGFPKGEVEAVEKLKKKT